MNSSPLKLINLAVGYKKSISCNINLEIKENEFVTIMGENGCGKTTLIDTIMGIQPKKTGDILLWGQTIHSMDDDRIGWVISQKEKYSPLMTIRQYFSILNKAYRKWDEDLCQSLLEKFDIDSSKRLYFLSLGEHSKVRLIKALSIRPQLLILDELTANLSPKSKDILTSTLLDMFSQGNTSVLYISHSEDESLRLSDRILVMDENGLTERGRNV